MAAMIRKPWAFPDSGTPPTFVPNSPATMLMGSAATVATASRKTLRLVCSADASSTFARRVQVEGEILV